MKQLSYKLVILAALFLVKTGSAQNYNNVKPRTQKVIDSMYTTWIKKYKVVGASLAIVDSGRIVYANGYGFSDRDKQTKATAKTIYRIGSCTKSFTSLSIMQLHEKKKLDINNSVKKYLPELKIESRFNDNNQIYINDMMAHVSGLPCDIMNGFFCDAPPSISWEIEQLNQQNTISPRRYKHAYSNVAYGLLGEVVARTSKTTYSSYVKENIFKPLQMSSSYIDVDTMLSPGFSKGYCNNKAIVEPLIRDQAAGLIHSNVLDMANYVQMYLNKGKFNGTQVLSPSLIKEMEENHLGDVLLRSKESWGYGLYSEKISVKLGNDSSVVTVTGHGGDTYAYHADFAYIPELNIGVVILTNTDKGTSINSANRLLKTYLKEEKSKKATFNYKDPADSLAFKVAEVECTLEEIKGKYNAGQFVINVKNPTKIKFKQGPAVIVMKQKKNDPKNYSIKARVFGVVPIKIKNQEITFVKINNQVYIKQFGTKSGNVDYFAIKSADNAIPGSWKNQLGKYTLKEPGYKCTGCPYGDSDGLTLKISEKNGFIVLTTKGKTPDNNGSIYSNVISDKLAISGGIGRGTGETIKILDNGNIYYSGFEFTKVK